jgi:hypothetical protein
MKMVVCAILTVNTTQHYTFGSEHGNVRNFGNQHYTTLHIENGNGRNFDSQHHTTLHFW